MRSAVRRVSQKYWSRGGIDLPQTSYDRVGNKNGRGEIGEQYAADPKFRGASISEDVVEPREIE